MIFTDTECQNINIFGGGKGNPIQSITACEGEVGYWKSGRQKENMEQERSSQNETGQEGRRQRLAHAFGGIFTVHII